jgi:4-diphosphocytidyl-2-C-methyl-D-erythritol kinase
MLDVVSECAPAKINLHLKVFPKRSDGYHPIESIFQTIPLYDDIVVRRTEDELSCVVKCDAMELPKENTLTKTYTLFSQFSGIKTGVFVELTKRIPSGAGLGGGSSDAATFLQCLNKMFDYPLNRSQMEQIANLVGSDVLFFLSGGAAIVTGRGDVVRSISIRDDLCFVVVYPDVHCSTAEAYSLVDEYLALGETDVEPTLQEVEKMYYEPISEWRFLNTFTNPVGAKFPVILEVIDSLKSFGADYVQMSGSGSTVFGVFSDFNLGKDTCTNLRKIWKECYCLFPNIQNTQMSSFS